LTRRRLSEQQIQAIEFLALPGRGGMTYEQIATEVGVHRDTLLKWRKNDVFNEAMKKRTVELTQERIPDVLEAAIQGIIEDRNAAIFRTFMQAHGLLTEKHEVIAESKGEDLDAMKARIASMRNKDDADA